MTPRYDLLAWNPAYSALMGDLEVLPRGAPQRAPAPVPRARLAHRCWPTGTTTSATSWPASGPTWRPTSASRPGATWCASFEEACPEFRELWSEHEVSGGAGGKRKRYLHPAVGLVECDTQTFFIGEQPGARLHVSVPADEASRLALERLSLEEPWRPWCDAVAAVT